MKRSLALLVIASCTHSQRAVVPPPTTASEPAPESAAVVAASDQPAHVDPAAAPKPPPTHTAPAGADQFNRQLFAQVEKSQKGNFAVAGGNVRDALVAVALGARGKTRDELVRALDLGDDAAADTKRERAGWNDAMGDAQLITASRIWFDVGHPLSPDYLAQAKDALSAEPQGVDFVHQAAAARTTVNDWASEQTRGKITELLGAGSVDARTRLVATSALYFKAGWATPFVAEYTKPAPFFVGKAKRDVPTMQRRGQMRAVVAADHVAVDLPYAHSGLSMLVVAARADGGIGALEEAYVQKGLAALQEGLSLADASLSLPKFTFRGGGSLSVSLKALGIKAAFGPAADLGGLFGAAPGGSLGLSDVVQRTFVAVDEKGTEAAAASAATVSVRSAMMGKPLDVRIDHAFLFFLHDQAGRVLFAGRVADPAAAP